jgi:hypothetical protein
MTEEEAKTKWCPMSRSGEYFSTNRGSDGITYDTDSCIASDCMMWRQDLAREEAENGYYAKNGHCGLGGKP